MYKLALAWPHSYPQDGLRKVQHILIKHIKMSSLKPQFNPPLLNPGMPLSSSAANSYQQGCIRMTLEDSELWKSFHTIGTEMIITKHGRRMFPHCSISLSGLQPFANYVIMVDIVPADNVKYKWKKEQWEVAGKSEPQPPCRTYIHPDSPAVGSHWMKQSLSFLKMKLTNNTLDQHGHVKTQFHTLNPNIYNIKLSLC
uniref:T-box domain-containing protein n=1 Tax=Poecilia reticulata TaxID=8081 RepID=A0A3P9NJ90_POERE